MHKYYFYWLVYLLFIITYLFWYFYYWTISITVKFTAQIISNSFLWGWADWIERDRSLIKPDDGRWFNSRNSVDVAHTRQKKIIKNFYRTPIQSCLCEITYCSNSNILCITHTADKQKKSKSPRGGWKTLE